MKSILVITLLSLVAACSTEPTKTSSEQNVPFVCKNHDGIRPVDDQTRSLVAKGMTVCNDGTLVLYSFDGSQMTKSPYNRGTPRF